MSSDLNEKERIEFINVRLQEVPFLSAKELQGQLGVSLATVRRDIEKVDDLGTARKVHGGIAAIEFSEPGGLTRGLPFIENRDIAIAEKRAIADLAESLVRDGSQIMIHGGSTCFYLGQRVSHRNVRVFTYSQPLASYLGENGTCQLTLGGGDLHREPSIFFDPNGPKLQFYASQYFVGALGVSADGLLESHPILARSAGEMAEMANEVVALVDSQKFSVRAPTIALPFDRISTLITDAKLEDKHAKMIEEQGVKLLVANPNPSTWVPEI